MNCRDARTDRNRKQWCVYNNWASWSRHAEVAVDTKTPMIIIWDCFSLQRQRINIHECKCKSRGPASSDESDHRPLQFSTAWTTGWTRHKEFQFPSTDDSKSLFQPPYLPNSWPASFGSWPLANPFHHCPQPWLGTVHSLFSVQIYSFSYFLLFFQQLIHHLIICIIGLDVC